MTDDLREGTESLRSNQMLFELLVGDAKFLGILFFIDNSGNAMQLLFQASFFEGKFYVFLL